MQLFYRVTYVINGKHGTSTYTQLIVVALRIRLPARHTNDIQDGRRRESKGETIAKSGIR